MGNPRYVLRDLPLPSRIVLSVFLLSVGAGYLSAVVQLHFQHARKGEWMPGPDETIRLFHDRTHNLPPTDNVVPPGPRQPGRIEELLVADPNQKLRPSTQMRTAFTRDSEDWDEEIVTRSSRMIPVKEVVAILEEEREGERLAVLAWVRADGPKAAYDRDSFTLPADWKPEQPVTAKYVLDGGKAIKFKSILTDRCVICHRIGGEADKVPFEAFHQIQKFVPEPSSLKTLEADAAASALKRQPGMGIEKLAQSTHVHLLGFSMLYCLTGMILSFSSYPLMLRCVLCPLPLLVQVLDIGCWWLAREAKPYGPMFAAAIPITGGIVAIGLLSHIVLSVFNMFGGKGKLVLVLVMAAAGTGGVLYVKPIAEAAIQREKGAAPSSKEESEKKAADAGIEKIRDADKKADR